MIMDCNCPHCGGGNFEMDLHNEENVSELESIRTWHCHCACGKWFIISDVQTITSRLVAKDDDELEDLIKQEMDEERA